MMKVILDHLEIDDFYRPKSHLRLPSLKKEVEFPWPIDEIIEFKKVYVIELDVVTMRDEKRGYEPYNENVFGVSKETGEIVWQITAVMRPDVDSPYTAIWKKSDKVVLGNWSGMDYTVDPETGEILTSLFTK